MDWLILILGLGFLLGGGELLVRGATALARGLGVSPLLIGLTVVAFGTSAPELAVNITAALRGQGGISFGNIMGSNVANIGLILGITARGRPLGGHRTIITRELPFLLIVTIGASLMALDFFLGEAGGEAVGRIDGIVLLICFVGFMIYTMRAAKREREGNIFMEEVEEAGEGPVMALPLAALLTVAGLAGVIGGGQWTVDGAVAIARVFGVSEAVIGLSIVALGTSLPELVTSLAAARAGHADLAVGNVVGSNLFNLLLVLGSTTVLRDVPLPEGGLIDLAVMVGLTIVLLPMAMGERRRINRFEGALLLATYLIYVGWRTLG